MGGTAEDGYLHCGPVGSGHFVKMVHNGIEYGIMQALAEGFDIMRGAGNPTVARVDENGAASASTAPESTVAEARPAQEPAVGTAGQEAAPAAAPARRRTALPRTGSDLGLVALMSALALAGAFGTRRARKHLATLN